MVEREWQLEIQGELTKQRRIEAIDKLLSELTLIVASVFGLQAIGLDGEGSRNRWCVSAAAAAMLKPVKQVSLPLGLFLFRLEPAGYVIQISSAAARHGPGAFHGAIRRAGGISHILQH